MKRLLAIAAVACAASLWAASASPEGPDARSRLDRWNAVRSASGRFTQRKTLADVNVSIVSSGVFNCVKGRRLEWKTLRPVETTFVATPGGYSFSAGGTTENRRIDDAKPSPALRALLDGDLSALPESFDVREDGGGLSFVPKAREVQGFLKRIAVSGVDFPSAITVEYANGDRLEIGLESESVER